MSTEFLKNHLTTSFWWKSSLLPSKFETKILRQNLGMGGSKCWSKVNIYMQDFFKWLLVFEQCEIHEIGI